MPHLPHICGEFATFSISFTDNQTQNIAYKEAQGKKNTARSLLDHAVMRFAFVGEPKAPAS